MANPDPVYVVTYNGSDLPGYLQNEDIPVNMNSASAKVMSRDGGFLTQYGADFKEINLTFRVISRLGGSATGLQHLADCKDQWRAALAIVARVDGLAQLYIGDTDRYVNALFLSSTAPLEAPTTKRMTYTLKFSAEPWFNGSLQSTSKAISGNDTITLNPGSSRRTYPVFTIPTGITGITITDQGPSGKSFSIAGAHANAIVVDCGTLVVSQLGIPDYSVLASDPDFGMYYEGDTNFTVAVSGVTGSGTVGMDIRVRYER